MFAAASSIADGNTWNHEHIALLGKCLTASQEDSHKIVRHLADYVLVWSTAFAGMHGDDLAKSPHMARIGAWSEAPIRDTSCCDHPLTVAPCLRRGPRRRVGLQGH